jgi:hypothetical protein
MSLASIWTHSSYFCIVVVDATVAAAAAATAAAAVAAAAAAATAAVRHSPESPLKTPLWRTTCRRANSITTACAKLCRKKNEGSVTRGSTISARCLQESDENLERPQLQCHCKLTNVRQTPTRRQNKHMIRLYWSIALVECFILY